jgi:uncharacterized protein (TIRG00374 family)
MTYRMTKKRMRRGLQLFSVLSLSSLVAIFIITHSHITAEAIRNMNPAWLLAALPFIVVDWLGGGYRLYLFARVFYPHIRFKTCMKANLANYFMGAITPSQTGGGAAQIYVLHAGGMPTVEATSASLMTFFSTTMFLIASAGGVFLLRRSVPLPGRLMSRLFNIGMLFFLGVTVLLLIAVAFPGFYRKVAKLFFVVLARLRKKDYFAAGGRVNGMLDGIDRIHQQLIHYLKKQWRIFILGILASGVSFLAKFVVAYIVVRSFAVSASFVNVSLLQMAIILINYFFPSPGGSGAAEFSAAALMASVLPTAYVPFYVVLWRLLTNYVSVAVGGMLFVRELGKREEIEVESVIDEGAPEELASVPE